MLISHSRKKLHLHHADALQKKKKEKKETRNKMQTLLIHLK